MFYIIWCLLKFFMKTKCSKPLHEKHVGIKLLKKVIFLINFKKCNTMEL